MSDADEAAASAESLARFAGRVREADRAPSGSSADRVKRLFARAALVLKWPTVRAQFADRPPTSDASLSVSARDLAERCVKGQKHGMFGGWPKEANELLTKAAERLSLLADRLDDLHRPSGVCAQLDRVFTRWQQTDPLTAALLHLDAELTARTDIARGLADAIAESENPFGFVSTQFDAKLTPAAGWTPDARAAAVGLCELIDRLTGRTSDPPVWEFVARWADGWFAAAGVSGKVLLEGVELPGVVVESFPLAGGRRVFLAVAGSGSPAADDPPVIVPDWPGVVSRADEAAFGTVVGDEEGRVVVSDGQVSPTFAAFHELYAAAREGPAWWGDGRWQWARELSRTPEPAAVAELAGRWLDECSPSVEQAELVCRWAEACGLEAVRVSGPESPGVEVRPVFAQAPAGTLVGTNRAGFRVGGTVLRAAVAEVSLGPSPAGFEELQRAGETLPPVELKALVASLRAAAEGDYLREAVLQLYSDYWGDAGDTARAADPTATAQVGDRLADLLQHGFDLTPFHPANVHDMPSGWISVSPASRVMTGVVRRVLRPGLQDGHGNLRIPAVVEAE